LTQAKTEEINATILPEKPLSEGAVQKDSSRPADRESVKPSAEPTRTGAFELNQRQRILLEKLKTIQRITRKEYAEILEISIPTAARDLKELVDKKSSQPKGPWALVVGMN